jgi:trimeric autotransporter adhesin
MAVDGFVQKATGTAAGPNPSATLNSVALGNALVAFLLNGDAAGSISGVSDGQGAYAVKGSLLDDTVNAVELEVFLLLNANAGTHVITGSCPSSAGSQITVVEVATTSGASAYSDVNGAVQASPGTGANAVTSGSVAVGAGSTIIAFSTDSASTATADEPAVGTGFTTRDNGANSFIGAFRLETGAFAAANGGTFKANTGTDRFVTAAIAILNGPGPAAALAGTPAASAAAAAALTTAIQAAAAASAGTSAAGVLTTEIKLASAAVAAIAATGALTTTPALGGAANTVAVVSGALTTGIVLAATATAAVNGTGGLTNWATVVLTLPLSTGLGSIVDAHLWPSAARLPQVGDTIYYDPAFVTVNPDSTVTSSSNNCAAVVQFFDGSTMQRGVIAFTPFMVGEADAALTAAGALTTQVLLACALVIAATASGSLGSSAGLSGTANVGTVVAGALLAALTATGALGNVSILAGIASTGSTMLGALTTAIDLAGTANAIATATANLMTGATLAGDAVALVAATAPLRTSPKISAGSFFSTQQKSADGLYWPNYPQGGHPSS